MSTLDLFATPEPKLERDVYSVSRLNREARGLLEGGFTLLWIEGEISNLARPASGHLYFSLKDADAQVRCAMFRMRSRGLRFTPENGMQVLLRVRVSLYEARGEFQLLVEHMEPAGEGALRQAFEMLKQRLAAEGLFDTVHKRQPPPLPRQIGVITSPSGAAIRDILTTLRRRFPAIPVLIYPIPVQGEDAARQIAEMLALANQRAECDVLILARGGGSLEDLWAFNEESVARALHASAIPVVSGIGHEIDFSIADFVADRRAATPTAAAEMLSPDRDDWLARLAQRQHRIFQATHHRLRANRASLDGLHKRLEQTHPGRRVQQQQQRMDELEQRLTQATHVHLRGLQSRLRLTAAGIREHTPNHRLKHLRLMCEQLVRRMGTALHAGLERRTRQLGSSAHSLDAISPLATLGRGYAIVSRLSDDAILRHSNQIEVGEPMQARLAQGRLICTVEERHDS